jgi:hypothetical protein
VGEKNGAGAMGADQWIFLSEMRIVAGDPGQFSGVAGACLTGKSVDAASSGTKDAGFQQVVGFFYFFF